MPETAVRDRPHSILIWQTGALGDTLLSYPAMQALRRWAPHSHISTAGRPAFLSFALRLGLIDTVMDVHGDDMPQPLGTGSGQLPIPELAIIWSAAAETLAAEWQAKGAGAIVYAPAYPATPRHQARYLLDCLRPLHVPQVLLPVPRPAQVAPRKLARTLLDTGDQPVVLLHAGAGAHWKRWPLRGYIELAALLQDAGIAVRWSCGPDESSLSDELRGAGVDALTMVWPQLGLEHFSSLMACCDLVVSADCGVAHLAALCGVPQVTLYGPTDPRRWRPFSRLARVVQAPLRCAGDWEVTGTAQQPALARRRCVPPDAACCRCLEQLSAQAVCAACVEMLAR